MRRGLLRSTARDRGTEGNSVSDWVSETSVRSCVYYEMEMSRCTCSYSCSLGWVVLSFFVNFIYSDVTTLAFDLVGIFYQFQTKVQNVKKKPRQ